MKWGRFESQEGPEQGSIRLVRVCSVSTPGGRREVDMWLGQSEEGSEQDRE